MLHDKSSGHRYNSSRHFLLPATEFPYLLQRTNPLRLSAPHCFLQKMLPALHPQIPFLPFRPFLLHRPAAYPLSAGTLPPIQNLYFPLHFLVPVPRSVYFPPPAHLLSRILLVQSVTCRVSLSPRKHSALYQVLHSLPVQSERHHLFHLLLPSRSNQYDTPAPDLILTP